MSRDKSVEYRTGQKRDDGMYCWVQKDGFVNWLTAEAYELVSAHAYSIASWNVVHADELHPGIVSLFANAGDSFDHLSEDEYARWLDIYNREVISVEAALMRVISSRK